MNMVDILRAFYVILDISNPELDDNMRVISLPSWPMPPGE